MRNKLFNRFLIMLLSVMMVVNTLPLQVFAEDTLGNLIDAAIFSTDVHGSTSDVSTVFGGIKGSGTYSTATFVGDTFTDTSSKKSTVTSAVQTALGDTNIECLYTWGDHDQKSDIADYTGLIYGDSTTNYYVYAISMSAMTDMSDSKTNVESSYSASLLTAFTDTVNGLDHTKPLFICTHMPLHDRRGDNTYASNWYGVISAAAEKMDVVVFWAHNHTSESSADTDAYYIEKDGTEKLEVYNGDSVVPNFTYMNAGYINANNQNPARIGVVTTVKIYENYLVFQDYGSSGAYSGNGAHNVSVAREFKSTVTLESIAITTPPTKTTYTVGDAFSAEGLVVTAVYSDSSTKDVTSEVTLSGYDMNTVGTQTVTATYEGLTETFEITVKEAAALSSIAVAGTTEYTVGGNGLNLTVTATYDDGSTADVTSDATFEPSELTASGVYTVTASYGEMTATIDVTVNLYDEVLAVDGESLILSVEAFSQGATALEVTWDDEADTILYEKGLYTDYVVYDLALTNPGETTEYAMSLVDNMDTTNLAVYHVADDGTLTLVEHKIENDCVVFTTSLTGAFAYGSITVPEGYTLSSITLENIPTDLFVGGSLDLTEAVITATYTKEGAEDYVRILTVYDFDENNFSGYDVNKVGAQTAAFTFEGVSASLDIHVWGDEFTVNNVTVQVGEGEYGVTKAVVAESTNANVATAIENVITGNNYVAYDITLTYEDGYAANEATKTVTLPIPEGVTNPVVYYVSDSGQSVVDMKAVDNGDGTVTFETTHFSTYVVGEGITITVPDNETAEGSSTISGEKKTVYVLADSISSGNEYLIVNSNTASTTTNYALANNNGTVAATDVIIKSGDIDNDGTAETYIELTDATDELWTVGGNYTFDCEDGYLYRASSIGSTPRIDDSYTTWSYNTSNHRLSYTRDDSTYYLYYSSGWKLTKYPSYASSIYFYVPTEINTTTTVSGTYSIDGKDVTVAAVANAIVPLSSQLVFTPTSGTATTEDVSMTATYEVYDADTTDSVKTGDPLGVIKSISGNVVTLSGNTGKALVKVSYDTNDDAEDGIVTDYITITATTPDHYSINLHLNNDGVLGEEIAAPVALKGIKAGDTYSVWAVVKVYVSANDETGTDLGTLGDALSWSVSDESIAKIDTDTGVITFTGTNYGTFTVTVAYEGADGKTITDTITISVTNTQYIVPGDGTKDFPEYPNEGAIRFDKNATAVGNYSETGIAKVELSMTGVPYTTGNELDVVLVLDMSTSMDDVIVEDDETTTNVNEQMDRRDVTIEAAKSFISTIVTNEDGSINNNRIAIYYFIGDEYRDVTDDRGLAAITDLDNDGDIDTDDVEELLGDVDDITYESGNSGTHYAAGLKGAYDTLVTAKTDGIGNERKQFCVFMSDGVPTEYQVTSSTQYSDSSSIQGMFTGTDYNTRDTDYKYEYYSTEMKKNGVTVYSVGVGLYNTNGAWNGKSANQCGNVGSILLNDISGPSGETTQPDALSTTTLSKKNQYFFSVDDGDAAKELSGVFTNIAKKIVEAATDVVVEDKIGSNYTVNFSIPGYGTDNQVSSDALDGTTEFYIQVVEYELNANKERTGDPTVLENFTFNSDGTLKSHTVDGTTCSNCAHVSKDANGVITKITGTYFTYENKGDDAGEYLTWTAEKIGTTELALQYFAYLNDSTGLGKDEEAIPAGTYYTNEYATLTYKNYLGNEVQQEFPIPQMTWNGAQVSYVFYLVNENGDPVNRAGRVVPFAEAVYVTDVHTESVIWNKLEQSAGLEASKLAIELVPDVYALYDDDASYMIHVYEDEEQDNLNNHFVIGGDVTDDYNKVTNTWTNANTTYVFNTKSDSNKYNEYGTYIANDGNASNTTTTYLCKGDGVVTATIEVVDVAEADFPDSAYYVLNDGKYALAAIYDSSETYYAITDASYSAVTGETHVTDDKLESKTGATIIENHAYYIDENNKVYTIVQKSNGTEVHAGFDFHNTTVAFAVVWKPELTPDTIVIDYGLDVVVDVYTNDGLAAGVKNVMLNPVTDVEMNKGSYDDPVGSTSVISTDGLWTASVENLTSVRFSMNEIGINAPAVFYYEAGVNYYTTENSVQTLNSKHMYSSVTVIPATTIYYEDEYVDLYTYERTSADGAWGNPIEGWDTNSKHASALQDVDRPGAKKEVMSSLYDADNVYGYDSAYENCSTYSLDNAAIVSVNSLKKATAKFSFYGTGFDVISLTSNKTGLMTVAIYKHGETTKYKGFFVDTYYGYEQNADGEWVVSVNTPNALYQVPVMEVADLPYDHYDVEITVAYNSFFDNNQYTQTDSETGEVTSLGKYDFYLDAIRIYDPVNDGANDSTSVTVNAYKADGEAWPMYHELRDMLITAKTFDSVGNDGIEGVVFIDSLDNVDSTKVVTDYKNYGPNNEVYLASGQSLSFVLNNASDAKAVHLGLKSVGGSTSYKIYDAEKSNITSAASNEINTATDLYHDITSLIGKNIVITNTGSNILSITNLKATYESNPTSTSSVMFMVRRSSVNSALVSLEPVVEDEVETPDVSNPEIDTPEINNPEVDPDTPVVEPETPNTGNTGTTTPETGNTEDNTSSEVTGPEAPEGGVSNEGKPSTDNTVESEGTDTETEVTPDHGTTEDEETVTPEPPVEETSEIEAEEQLGFFASLIKMIVDFFVSMFSWLIGLVA